MKIVYLKIVNFKSIRDLEINDMENSLILVGKNSTGKTSVIDAVLSAAGLRQVYANEFLEPGKPIEISMKISFTDEDLQYYYTKGILSKIRNYEKWLEEFLDESIPLWRGDPVLFMREVLLFEPDDWQIEVAYDLRDYPRVSVKSGQGGSVRPDNG